MFSQHCELPNDLVLNFNAKKKLNRNKKVICLVIPTLQSGGMERVMSELADYLSHKNDGELHLVLYGKGREIFYELPESITIHQPDWPFDNRKRARHSMKTMLFLREKIKKIDPDTVLSFGEYWNSFVLIALFGLKYPVYISDRCSPVKNLGKTHEFLRRYLYPRAAGIIAQTSKAKSVYMEKQLNDTIRVIGNPVRDISQNSIPSEDVDNEKIVLTVGRLIDTKHHDRLIDIFKEANPGGWKLIIVGGNAIKQDGLSRLTKKIEKAGLSREVELAGTVNEVDKYYSKSKIFAFTSSSEGFPNVIGEAMSAGLPIITYDCVAGPNDMVKDGENGFLIGLFDDRSFERRMRELMADEKLRNKMGKRSKELIQKFDKNTIGEEYYTFISRDL